MGQLVTECHSTFFRECHHRFLWISLRFFLSPVLLHHVNYNQDWGGRSWLSLVFFLKIFFFPTLTSGPNWLAALSVCHIALTQSHSRIWRRWEGLCNSSKLREELEVKMERGLMRDACLIGDGQNFSVELWGKIYLYCRPTWIWAIKRVFTTASCVFCFMFFSQMLLF